MVIGNNYRYYRQEDQEEVSVIRVLWAWCFLLGKEPGCYLLAAEDFAVRYGLSELIRTG